MADINQAQQQNPKSISSNDDVQQQHQQLDEELYGGGSSSTNHRPSHISLLGGSGGGRQPGEVSPNVAPLLRSVREQMAITIPTTNNNEGAPMIPLRRPSLQIEDDFNILSSSMGKIKLSDDVQDQQKVQPSPKLASKKKIQATILSKDKYNSLKEALGQPPATPKQEVQPPSPMDKSSKQPDCPEDDDGEDVDIASATTRTIQALPTHPATVLPAPMSPTPSYSGGGGGGFATPTRRQRSPRSSPSIIRPNAGSSSSSSPPASTSQSTSPSTISKDVVRRRTNIQRGRSRSSSPPPSDFLLDDIIEEDSNHSSSHTTNAGTNATIRKVGTSSSFKDLRSTTSRRGYAGGDNDDDDVEQGMIGHRGSFTTDSFIQRYRPHRSFEVFKESWKYQAKQRKKAASSIKKSTMKMRKRHSTGNSLTDDIEGGAIGGGGRSSHVGGATRLGHRRSDPSVYPSLMDRQSLSISTSCDSLLKPRTQVPTVASRPNASWNDAAFDDETLPQTRGRIYSQLSKSALEDLESSRDEAASRAGARSPRTGEDSRSGSKNINIDSSSPPSLKDVEDQHDDHHQNWSSSIDVSLSSSSSSSSSSSGGLRRDDRWLASLSSVKEFSPFNHRRREQEASAATVTSLATRHPTRQHRRNQSFDDAVSITAVAGDCSMSTEDVATYYANQETSLIPSLAAAAASSSHQQQQLLQRQRKHRSLSPKMTSSSSTTSSPRYRIKSLHGTLGGIQQNNKNKKKSSVTLPGKYATSSSSSSSSSDDDES